jgi:O-antigen/teichoic acid export membrane protein
LIITFAGSEALGYYSLGSLGIAALGYIPIAVNQVMFPKFASRFGETRDPLTLAGYLRIPTLLTAHTMAFILSVAILCLPLVTILLPEYSPGISSASLLLAGFYFVALTGSSANMMLTIGRTHQYLFFLGGAIGLTVTLDIIALSSGWGINGVAATTGFVNILYCMTFVRFTVNACLQPGANPFGPVQEKLLLPWILGFSLYWLAMQVNTGGIVPATLLRVLVFSVAYLPVSLLITRRERLW